MAVAWEPSCETLRHERGLTMKEVAAIADLTESFVSQVERDSVNPSVASLLRIGGPVLDVYIADLFDPPVNPNGRVVRASRSASRFIYPGLRYDRCPPIAKLQRKAGSNLGGVEPGESSGTSPTPPRR